MTADERYMRRALRLAAAGRGEVSPNPMVGAVVVCDGQIIGEGYHRRYGGPHAEVNAINSVVRKDLLPESTIYVTLEPCAHYGKTPPCADLIVRTGLKRVVVGCRDPFAKVDGRGIDRIAKAGIEVTVGVLERECLEINRRFITAHSFHRPYVTLKWACSEDGYIGRLKPDGQFQPVKFSSLCSSALVHKLRSEYDAIMVGSGTMLSDCPRLDVRLVSGRSPRPVIADRRGRITLPERMVSLGGIVMSDYADIPDMLSRLYAQGITSLIVEGGASLLNSFIGSGVWDDARVEVAPIRLGPEGYGRVPFTPLPPYKVMRVGANSIYFFENIRPD